MCIVRTTAQAIAKGLPAVVALPIALWASAGRADVLEISPQGAVIVYSAPTVFTAAGAVPIMPALALRSRAGTADEVLSAIAEASRRYALPTSLIQAVAWRESHFQQRAVSPKGAIGVMQLMAGTARELGVNPYDLRQNVLGGAAYLDRMLTRYGGDSTLALAAYNAGPGAVDRHAGVPPFRETQRYVAQILASLPSSSPLLQSPLIFGR